MQCAIAQEQHQRACTFFQPESQVGSAIAGEAGSYDTAKSDGNVPTWSPSHPGNVTSTDVDLSKSLDSSQVWISSCPADRVFAAPMGLVVTFPISQVCAPLQLAGNALLGVCFFIAAFIVFYKKGG